MPLNANIGGKPKLLQIQDRNILKEDQARHVYKKVESCTIINVNTLKQEIIQDQELNRLGDMSEEINPINPYRELIVNNEEKVETFFITNGTVVNTK